MNADGAAALYPNPSSGNTTLLLPNTGNPAATIRIYDMSGALLSEQTENGSTITLQTAGLAADIYFVEITQNGGTQRLKLVRN